MPFANRANIAHADIACCIPITSRFQLAFPAGYVVARMLHWQRKLATRRLETLVDRSIHGNAVVLMVLHPPISQAV